MKAIRTSLKCSFDSLEFIEFSGFDIISFVVSFAVPPAYYAHLAAFRARFYLEPEMQDNNSSTGASSGRQAKGGGTKAAGESGVRPLPALKENVKRVMFYC